MLLSASTGPPDLQDVLDMESLKTAGYSFEAPLKAGALLAGRRSGPGRGTWRRSGAASASPTKSWTTCWDLRRT